MMGNDRKIKDLLFAKTDLKMKNPNIKAILIFCTFSLCTSCDNFLDIEPETSLSTAIAFDNIPGIEAGINGAYSIMQSDWVERQYIFAECLAGNVNEVNTLSNSNYQKALRHEAWTDLFNTANYLWDMSYQGLDLANQIIQALPNIEGGTPRAEADKAQFMGEALFLRGLFYFVLNRFYAQPQNGLSVPLLTEPFVPGDMPSRATIEEVKAQVIADLKEAETFMDGIDNNDGRATIWAARALLARVYFEYKDYANAEAYSNAVIESGKFSLIDGDVEAAYGTNISSENIFTFLSIPTDRAAQLLFERYSLLASNVQLSVSADFWAIISQDPDDLRASVLHEDLGQGIVCYKYDDREMNIPYIRLPEMYLIRAESRANQDKLDNALADLNRLKQRAGTSSVDYTDKADLLEKILTDRSLELSMEGDNFHNLKRLEQAIGGFPWEEAQFKLVFFIPEKETQLNPNIVQNETW